MSKRARKVHALREPLPKLDAEPNTPAEVRQALADVLRRRTPTVQKWLSSKESK